MLQMPSSLLTSVDPFEEIRSFFVDSFHCDEGEVDGLIPAREYPAVRHLLDPFDPLYLQFDTRLNGAHRRGDMLGGYSRIVLIRNC